MASLSTGCISFDSYIKPQRKKDYFNVVKVVYLLIPTSNHNCILSPTEGRHVVYLLIPTSNHNIMPTREDKRSVVYLLIPTSNHNRSVQRGANSMLYIFWFLHQTTTEFVHKNPIKGCISFDSYIKPQPTVYHVKVLISCISFDSYIKPQLVMTPILPPFSCISFDSYIKPQRHTWRKFSLIVVYLLIPTSNHNLSCVHVLFFKLYIFWFLHQTTTAVADNLHPM